MKKTLIALFALTGAAIGETVLPSYDLKVITAANTTADSTTADADFWFGSDSLTLNSYMIDFTIDAKPNGAGKYYFKITSTDDSTDYIQYGAWGQSAAGCGIYVGTGHNHAVTDDNSLSFNIGDTIRFAYDGTQNMAYLYNVRTSTLSTFNIGADKDWNNNDVDWGSGYSFVSGKSSSTNTTGATRALADATRYATYGNITDLSSLAGNSKAFQTYVTSLTVIPEPATATLSLLALAGLAARRRRK